MLSAVMLVLGVAMIVRAVTAGGGVLAVGVVFGALFVAAGLGRLWVGEGPRLMFRRTLGQPGPLRDHLHGRRARRCTSRSASSRSARSG